ncbi:hypothetical protein RFI_38266 [Reticulomyxa filosa]|uniref:Uncharacterized protein n=1 Tax=Reticulomyxa filosa TaxID=46433 RepID=X6LCV7_RETFI|nr:hypothetical protein RFI_38266 [Reticulomyxa filosa]|eukprot:ETN99215.1 hypothetical protein RFI_38266 [Reticulomyxa filosa]
MESTDDTLMPHKRQKANNGQDGHHQHEVGGQAQQAPQENIQQVNPIQQNQQEVPNVHEEPAQEQQSSLEMQEQVQTEQSQVPQAAAQVQGQVLLEVQEDSELKQDRGQVQTEQSLQSEQSQGQQRRAATKRALREINGDGDGHNLENGPAPKRSRVIFYLFFLEYTHAHAYLMDINIIKNKNR